MTKPSGPHLRLLPKALCLVVSLIALFWVIRHVDLKNLAATLSQANILWILAALAIFGVAFALAAARWHIVLQMSNCTVSPGTTMRTVLIGHLFNTILFGPTGGDIAKSALYARGYRFPASTILATCVLDRFLGGVGFLVFATCTPGFGIFSQHWSDRLNRLAASPRVGITIAACGLLLLGFCMIQRRLDWRSPFKTLIRATLANASQLLVNPRLASLGLFLAVLCHLTISGVFLFSLKAVTETPFSLVAVFWVFPVISLITSAPVTFSGAGLREGAALYFLGKYGIPAADAVAASLLVLCTYLVWAIVGGILFLRWQSRTESDPHSESVPVSDLKHTPEAGSSV